MAAQYGNDLAIFEAVSKAPERRYHAALFKGALDAGYTSVHLPAAGIATGARDAVAQGWRPDRVHLSEVGIVPAAVCCVLAGRHPSELEPAIDGRPMALPDDPVRAAAEVLATQVVLRLRSRTNVNGWRSAQIDRMVRDHEQRVEEIARRLEPWTVMLKGVHFTLEGIIEHIDRVKGDPKALVFADPPHEMRFFPKLYGTAGRMTWAEPEYAEWEDPPTAWANMLRSTADDEALIVLGAMANLGNGVRAGHVRPERLTAEEMRGSAKAVAKARYIAANKPDVLDEIAGRNVVVRGDVRAEPLEEPLIPFTWDVTEESTIGWRFLTPGQKFYISELNGHGRYPASSVTAPVGIIVDGWTVGFFAYDNPGRYKAAAAFAQEERTIRILTMVAAPNHRNRLGRLIRRCVLGRPILQASMGREAVGVERLSGSHTSPYGQAKAWRGLAEIDRRVVRPDSEIDMRYTARVLDESLEDALKWWLADEAEYLHRKANPPMGRKARRAARRAELAAQEAEAT